MGAYRFVRPRGSGRTVNSDSYFAGPWGLIVGVGVLVVVAIGVIKLIQRVEERTETDKNEAASKGGIQGRKQAPVYSSGPPAAPSETRKGPAPGAQPLPPRAILQQALNDLNVAVVSSEVARLRRESRSQGRFNEEAMNAAGRVAAANDPNLADHLQPGDEITAFETFDLKRMREEDAAATLQRALEKKSTASYYRFRVRRDGERELSVLFPAQTGGSAGDFSPTGRIQVSNKLALDIQNQVLSLPVSLLPQTERKEIERILGKGEATPEEYQFLTRRMTTNDAGMLEKDAETFRSQVGILEKMLPTAPVAETLVTKDGRRISGSIYGDTPAAVTIEAPYGKITVRRADVGALYAANEIRDEFKHRLEGSRDKPQALRDLLTWTKDWQLPVQHEYVAFLLLQLFPQDPQARTEAGYTAGPGGRWIMGTNFSTGAKPSLPHPANRAELQAELQRIGYILRGDHWFSKEVWTTGLDTLHSPGGIRMTMSGCQIYSWHVGDTPQGRLFNPSGKPKDGSPPLLRFVAPAGPTGTVSITVEAPAELYECHVKATGNVIERSKQGKIECYITPDGASTQSLYTIESASDESFHDITTLVHGRRKFVVSARLTTVVDKFATYARFLESTPDSKEVFSVKGTLLQGAPELDRTWANMRQ